MFHNSAICILIGFQAASRNRERTIRPMSDFEDIRKQLKDIREALEKLAPGSRAYQKLSEERTALETQLTGSGAVAQGDGAIAVGANGISVGKDISGTLITGEQNQVIRNSTVIMAGDGARILVGEHVTEQSRKPDVQAVASFAPTATNILTFLFTDIVGSTQLWEQHPEAMKPALARHDAILRGAIESHKGKVFKTVGDAFYAAFPNARNALKAALAAQHALHAETWGETVIKVRMAIHTGAVEARDGDYFGPPLNRVARLLSAGHGGQTLISAVTRELVHAGLPPSASLRDMGERSLRDLIRPERIYQLDAEGLPTEFPPLKTLDAFRTNLPVQLTSFIGREKEIGEVKELAVRNRLVTLTGSGGAGKTRLSLQVAANLLDVFQDGVWFVELASLTDPVLAPQTVATALGLREEAGRPLVDTLTNYLHMKSVLLILDNCEHLIETTAQLVEALLQACPNLRLLVSSRESLGIRGETTFRVPSLSIPDIRIAHSVEMVMQSESARLFVERAQTALPSFVVTKENVPSLAQVCARLDGIPLAIELAAARVKMLKVEQIAQRLDDRFRLLTGGSRTALPRQQTLRALIDWSFDLLPESERALLRRLSVFSGGWTLEAAETVCHGSGIDRYDVLDLLTQLVNKSLVVVVDTDDISETRYRLLETVRQYAGEKLSDTGDGIQARDQHLQYFLELAERAGPELTGPQVVEWLRRLEDELDNIRTALEWSLNGDVQTGLRLASALAEFWIESSYVRDGHNWLTQLINKPQAQAETLTRARALGIQGFLLTWGDFDQDARPILEESLVLCRRLGDRQRIPFALFYLGILAFREGDFEYGRQLVFESLALYRELSDKAGMASVLAWIGTTVVVDSDYQRAHTYLDESLLICREAGNLTGMARGLSHLGDLDIKYGNYDNARRQLEEALTIQRQLGRSGNTIQILARLGELAARMGDNARAHVYYEESLSLISQAGGNFIMMRWVLVKLGYAALRQGNDARARDLLEQSLHHFKKNGEKIGVIYTLEGWAGLAMLQGQFERAAQLIAWADHGRKISGHPRPPVEQADVDRDLATIRAQLDEATFAAAQATGRAMTMDEAIAYALKTDND
jgi:predicted ATPase/class 3 adenylate cyclase